MFCPKCRTEYRDGFYVCADCNVDLVVELPAEEEPEIIDYVEVMRTHNSVDIAMIKSVLDAENITYCFFGEQIMYVSPYSEPARLMVKRDEADRAKEILRELDLSIGRID